MTNEMITRKAFLFVRHGRTDWNDKSLCQGQLDTELNSAGILEAHLVGKFLQALPISTIFTSPLRRAHETAAIIAGYQHQCSLHSLDQLKERNWGNLEGISSNEMYRIEELEEANPRFLAEETIEPRIAFQSRIAKGINLALSLDKEMPLIVSHGRVFLVLCNILKIPIIRQIPNTTVIHCTPSLNGWEIKFRM
jgi:broad specificity phosphatase PhoE